MMPILQGELFALGLEGRITFGFEICCNAQTLLYTQVCLENGVKHRLCHSHGHAI